LDLAKLLVLHLQDFNAEITCIDRGDVALQVAQQEQWDLLILDLRLPGMDGLEICRRLRAAALDMPILMLTARSAELDRVLGLELGADDYLTKPFSAMELAARVKALLRRSERQTTAPVAQEKLLFNQLSIDRTQRSVVLGNKAIELTAREFDLLWFFATNPGRVFRRSELLDSVWGYGHEGYEHTVNSHINRLRAKIEADASNPQLLLTVWGVGYKFNEECA
jgi:DNA-binding response OmpR family regulator